MQDQPVQITYKSHGQFKREDQSYEITFVKLTIWRSRLCQ